MNHSPEIIAQSLLSPPITEGKTKKIFQIIDDPKNVILVSKDDITAGDGAKHDLIVGKARLSNETTCNVFRLLKECGIPVAFHGQVWQETFAHEFGDPKDPDKHGFSAPRCAMLPFEVVVRRLAYGSYLDRNPHLEKGHVFQKLVVEFFLKTSGKIWKGVSSGVTYSLVKDDPLISFDWPKNDIDLYYPGHSADERKTAPKGGLVGQKPFRKLSFVEVFGGGDPSGYIKRMEQIAKETFLVLEKAWQLQEKNLADFKVEFGHDLDGNLLLADVIDNDSWRVIDVDGSHMDKQLYREGAGLDTVTRKYMEVADLTRRFTLPMQQLIIWRGSENDDISPFHEVIEKLGHGSLRLGCGRFVVTCSVHRQPALAYRILGARLAKVPDSVIIAYIGLSNGAGPTLSANSSVPVITVPATYREFPDDVWSSLRVPSNVPVMTVLEPKNAVLAALKILAMRNPSLYAILRVEQEYLMTDI